MMKWDRGQADKDNRLQLNAWTDDFRIRVQAEDFEAEHFTVTISTLRRMTPEIIKAKLERVVERLRAEPKEAKLNGGE